MLGLCHRFDEVKGYAPILRLRLKDFTLRSGSNTYSDCDGDNTDTDYDGDNEGNDSHTDYNMFEDTCQYIPDSQPVQTNPDSRLDTNCEGLDTDSTRLDSDCTTDTLPHDSDSDRTPLLPRSLKRQRRNDHTDTDTDATPLLSRPPRPRHVRVGDIHYESDKTTDTLPHDSDRTPLLPRSLKRQRRNDHTDTDTDATPLLSRPPRPQHVRVGDIHYESDKTTDTLPHDSDSDRTPLLPRSLKRQRRNDYTCRKVLAMDIPEKTE